jgi:DNA-binding transcriptional LysR family regulator
MNNQLMVMMRQKKSSNLPKFGQFGKLLELLATNHNLVVSPPLFAEFNHGHNVVHVETTFCEQCLQEKLNEAGFDVTVGYTHGGNDVCSNHCQVALA